MVRRLIIASLLAALPLVAQAEAELVQEVREGNSSSGTTLTATLTVTGGNFLHVIAGCNDTLAELYVSDGVETFTKLGSDLAGGGIRQAQWAAGPITGGTKTITLTQDWGCGNRYLMVREIAGVTEVQAYNASSQASPGTGTDGVTVSATVSTAPAFISAATIRTYNNVTINAGTGYTLGARGTSASDSGSGGWATEHRRVTSTGSTAATFTTSNNGQHLTHMAVFTEAEDEPPPDPPSFSAAPSVTGRTTSSITLGFTADQAGTAYCVRVVDGSGAPSASQVKAGQNSSGSSAVQAGNVSVSADTPATLTFSGITDGTVTDGYCVVTNANGDSDVEAIADLYKIPAFTAAPSVTAVSTSAYTISKTLDGPGTVYCVAVKVTDAAPSVSQVEAGQNAAGTAALAAASANATATLSLSGLDADVRPIHAIYCAGTYGGQHQAAVESLGPQLLDAGAGAQFVVADVPWTDGALSVFEGADPAVSDGDVWRVPTLTTPDAYAIIADPDGTFVIVAGGDESRQSFVNDVFDVSADAWMGEFTIWVNNHAPVQIGAPTSWQLTANVGSMYSLDWSAWFDDQDGDALVFTLSPDSPDALPDGLIFSGGVISGTATTGGTATLIVRATDITGEYTDSVPFTLVLIEGQPTSVAGTGVDALGRMMTVFLGDAETVPADAVFISGFAHAHNGARYVAAWPADGAVVYARGIARRQDGAMIVVAGGTPAGNSAGFQLTGRGEVLVTEQAPVNFLPGGWGTDGAGYLSITEGPP